MPKYQAPLQEINFLIHEVFNLKSLLALPHFNTITMELVDTILEEANKIICQLLLPLNQIGDQQGCKLINGQVHTPDGFKQAYHTLQQAGWPSLTGSPEYGGQGLPHTVGFLISEMMCSANVSFALYPDLTHGVSHAIDAHASDHLKQIFLPPLIAGRFTGAMCLTEAHCGTDLSLVRTKAQPQKDDTYLLSGTKIFITAGDHDLAENIIHLVLARTPDAPPGIKGLSLFLVPKFFVNENGSLGKRNNFVCSSLEHKMGIKGSATCVINYENATGYLVGPLHQGMSCMFTVMNIERLSIGMQGLGAAEIAYQNALHYAKERLQGRSATGAVAPDKIADPIIAHPDVRRMLLTIKTQNEAARALIVWIGIQVDYSKHHTDKKIRMRAQALVELFTPIIKAHLTDQGFDSCNLALQVLGGHGYIAEWGLEQFVRDSRIAQIYEGTNGVQAMDLVKRKLIINQGEYLNYFLDEIQEFLQQHANNPRLAPMLTYLDHAQERLHTISQWIMEQAKQDMNIVGSCAVDYLNLFAHCAFTYMWCNMSSIAERKLEQDSNGFYRGKLMSAQFYLSRLLPKIDSLFIIIKSGSKAIMQMAIEQF